MNEYAARLAAAEEILGHPDSSEAAIDRIVAELGGLDIAGVIDAAAAGELDPAVLNRVISVLSARRAAIGVELAGLGRERAALARRHRGVAGYVQSGG